MLTHTPTKILAYYDDGSTKEFDVNMLHWVVHLNDVTCVIDNEVGNIIYERETKLIDNDYELYINVGYIVDGIAKFCDEFNFVNN